MDLRVIGALAEAVDAAAAAPTGCRCLAAGRAAMGPARVAGLYAYVNGQVLPEVRL